MLTFVSPMEGGHIFIFFGFRVIGVMLFYQEKKIAVLSRNFCCNDNTRVHEIKRFEQKHKQEHLCRTDQGLGRIAGTWIQTGAHSIVSLPPSSFMHRVFERTENIIIDSRTCII